MAATVMAPRPAFFESEDKPTSWSRRHQGGIKPSSCNARKLYAFVPVRIFFCRQWRCGSQHGSTRVRCFQADTAEYAVAKIRQEQHGGLFQIGLAFSQAIALLRHCLDYADAIQALGIAAVTLRDQLWIARQKNFSE